MFKIRKRKTLGEEIIRVDFSRKEPYDNDVDVAKVLAAHHINRIHDKARLRAYDGRLAERCFQLIEELSMLESKFLTSHQDFVKGD
jgi:hypothetical protein